MVFDPDSNRAIIFAGVSPDSFLSEVWSLSLTQGAEQWTELAVAGSIPERRGSPAFSFDALHGKAYMFGGWNYPPYNFYDDLHALDLRTLTWTQLHPTGRLPLARRNAPGFFDPFHCNFSLFGGQGFVGFLSDNPCVNVGMVGLKEWRGSAQPGVFPQLVVRTVSTRCVQFRYVLPRPGSVTLRIIDVAGRVVRRLCSETKTAASGWVTWDGKDEAGRPVSGGSYLAYLEFDGRGISRKLTLVQ